MTDRYKTLVKIVKAKLKAHKKHGIEWQQLLKTTDANFDFWCNLRTGPVENPFYGSLSTHKQYTNIDHCLFVDYTTHMPTMMVSTREKNEEDAPVEHSEHPTTYFIKTEIESIVMKQVCENYQLL